MTKVMLRPGESPESLLRQFRKKAAQHRVLSDARRERHFVLKSEQRRIEWRERKRPWREQSRQR